MEKRSHIFISYAHEDQDVVASLYDRLKNAGLDVWWDKKSLKAGELWRPAIEKAIQKSQMVAILLSKKSINKTGFYQKEIVAALDYAEMQPEGAIFIVPIRIEECEVPDRLKKYHWLDLFNEDEVLIWISGMKKQTSQTVSFDFSVARVEFTYKNTAWLMDKHSLSFHNLFYPNGSAVGESIWVGATKSFDILPGYYSFYLMYEEWGVDPAHRSGYEKSVKTNKWEGKLFPGLHKFLIRKPDGLEFQNIGNSLSIVGWPLTFFAYYKQRITLEYMGFQEWKNTDVT